jgi:hypothetical protein
MATLLEMRSTSEHRPRNRARRCGFEKTIASVLLGFVVTLVSGCDLGSHDPVRKHRDYPKLYGKWMVVDDDSFDKSHVGEVYEFIPRREVVTPDGGRSRYMIDSSEPHRIDFGIFNDLGILEFVNDNRIRIAYADQDLARPSRFGESWATTIVLVRVHDDELDDRKETGVPPDAD